MVATSQRHTRAHPCLLCGGYDQMPRGKGERCAGFISADGEWEHCERVDGVKLDERTTPPTYAHKLHGRCPCGQEHDPASPGATDGVSAPRSRMLYPRVPTTWQGAKLVKTWPYHDASGRFVYQVARYDKPKRGKAKPEKTYRPWQPVDGQWACDEQGLTRVLYRLPELLKADPDEPVFIPEGEKCVDAIRALGLVATTNPGGALTWHKVTDASEALKARHVVILPDNDPEMPDKPAESLKGQRHAEQVAAALYPVAASVRVLMLPGLPIKGDVADWRHVETRDYCGIDVDVRESLLRFAEQTPLWTPPQQPPEQPKMPNAAKMPKDAQYKNEGILGAGGHLRAVKLSEVQPEKVEWLDRGYIPIGKITGIIGDPGLGKSTLTLHYIACHTCGKTMPGGTTNPPGNAVLMSAEDGLADTIVPRLLAAGADVARVTALTCLECIGENGSTREERPIFIPRDLPYIRRELEENHATLLVIDPLTAYLDPDVNSHRDQDVRTALAPLARMADETGCAVLLVRHLNKSTGGNTLYRGGGSIGITGAERAELVVAMDPDDENKRVVAVHKHNLSKPVSALTFEIQETKDEQPYVHWLGTSTHTAAQLLAVPADGESRSETDEAVEWLRTVLSNADGQLPARDVKAKARDEGISDKVLRSARVRICEKPTKEGFGSDGGWIWRLAPPKVPSEPKNDEDAQPHDEAILDDSGHPCEQSPTGRHEYAKQRNARNIRLCIHCQRPESEAA